MNLRRFSTTCALAVAAAACSHRAQPARSSSEEVTTLPQQEQAEVIVQPLPSDADYLPPTVDTQGQNPLDMPGKKSAGYKNPFPAGTFEHFAAQKQYPTTREVFSDDRLLGEITATNAKIIICLPQQRARLYVFGRVGLDWPVSTGIAGHETPTGAFRIMEKSRQHFSSRYGKWVNARGKVVDTNADLKQDAPTGATFQPSSMPCWNRLTWDGVGIHGGRVVPGKALSHGCIRTPFDVARKLYEYTLVGMPVYVSRAIEDYNQGGRVNPDDVKYRPTGDHTDLPTTPAPDSREKSRRR